MIKSIKKLPIDKQLHMSTLVGLQQTLWRVLKYMLVRASCLRVGLRLRLMIVVGRLQIVE